MKTILATAYAVNPYKGSEDAMGWNYVYQIAKKHNVIAITRKNNRNEIERYMTQKQDPVFKNMSFVYYDLPKWKRFWKKGQRGALLYFYLWQKSVVNFIKKEKLEFDIVHNLNFHNDWTPSFLWKLNKPFVWGHIGHHPQIPNQYLKDSTFKTRLKNKATWWIKKGFWKYSPSLKKTIEKADQILCMHEDVPKVIPLDSSKYAVSPSVASQDYGWNEESSKDRFDIISAGRFVPLKGFDLTIESFAKFMHDNHFPHNCHLTLIGDGPLKDRLIETIKKLGMEDYITIIPWIERAELLIKMKSASAFMFPSHEGAGMVIPEALSFGLPCIVLNNVGPGRFIEMGGGIAVNMNNRDQTIYDMSKAIKQLVFDETLYEKLRKSARSNFEKNFNWDNRSLLLEDVYSKALNKVS